MNQEFITRLKSLFIAVMLLLAVLPLAISQPAFADCISDPTSAGCPCALNSSSAACKDLSKPDGLSNILKNATNIVLFIAGALAVIMIIYGSIRFMTAHGNEKQVESARLIVTYSVIGLIIAILAYALVNFVLSNL
ncbi:hypothetical protein EUA61_02045 [TM7 phylum sp. oral taxon 346]|nr:hypothetical protein EUA61_02045 [TM7 phylum sp. oral taxon 346]